MKRYVRNSIALLLAMLLVISMFPCNTLAASEVKISKTKATVYVGKTYNLKLSGTKSKITWSSSDKKIATVSQKGLVTGIKSGKVNITAQVGKKKYICKVTVSKVAINKSKLNLKIGSSFTLKINGENASKVKWSSSNSKVATVSSNGKVIAKSSGSATITGKVGTKNYKCNLVVANFETKDGKTKDFVYQIGFNGVKYRVAILEYIGGNKDTVTVPSQIEGYPVTDIAHLAFSNAPLKSITLPNTLEDIDKEAFFYCTNLNTINIPSSVETIGNNAFSYCTSLNTITLPNSITYIPDSIFSECLNLASVKLPSRITAIGDTAFLGCKSLSSINIPTTVTSVGSGAFSGCSSLDNVNIPHGITNIEYNTFGECTNLTNITIPDTVTSIDSEAFWGCDSLTSITIPSSVTSINKDAFRSHSDGFIIKGKAGSYAQTYAMENSIPFEAIT